MLFNSYTTKGRICDAYFLKIILQKPYTIVKKQTIFTYCEILDCLKKEV